MSMKSELIAVYLLQGLGYGFTAAVQPGPFQTYVISQALRRGWLRTLPAALAPLISDGPIILIAMVALNQLPQGWERWLSLAGGLFVLYLAWGAYRTWRDAGVGAPDAEDVPAVPGVWKAALMNALSPGPYLFWGMVTGPILLRGWRRAPVNGALFLLGFYAAMVGSLAALILFFSLARRLGPKVNRILVGLSAVALFGFGLLQVVQSIRGFL
jgi:threonine/homoserine/homoserine lactone efflux protein